MASGEPQDDGGKQDPMEQRREPNAQNHRRIRCEAPTIPHVNAEQLDDSRREHAEPHAGREARDSRSRCGRHPISHSQGGAGEGRLTYERGD